MAKKFFIETFGCQMNELDSEKIAGNLRHQGLEPVTEVAEADLVVLNTCSVREKAVQKVYARLGELKRQKLARPDMVLGVVGCMAQLEGEKLLRRAPFVNVLAGPQKGHSLGGLVQEYLRSGAPAVDLRMEDDPEPLETSHVLRESPRRAGVTISEGCDRLCSFCVVPQTRGKERARASTSILRELEGLAEKGYCEVVLLGQTVNSYRDPWDRNIRFADLLRRVAEIEGLKRIRFTSPHPNDVTDDLVDVMVSYPQVCDQIHLPVQSGSDRILKSMRRGYTREKYLGTVRKLQSAARQIALSTDIIVGFPGETEADFADTLSLLDQVQYDNVFSFKYSPRPNTEALGLSDEVPDDEKRKRLSILQQQQKLIQYNRNAAYVGRVVEVLVEARARSRFTFAGRTSNNKTVNFDGPESLMGQLVQVEITSFSANSLKGVWIKSGSEES